MGNSDAQSPAQLLQARQENNAKQRKANIWMGRDNEFRNIKRGEPSASQRTTQEALTIYSKSASNGPNLRKHNFSFGFEPAGAAIAEKQIIRETEERNLYAQAHNITSVKQQRREQETKNRTSNIKWGLKSEQAVGGDNMRQTQNSFAAASQTDLQKDIKTIESSRTQQHSTNNRRDIYKSHDFSQLGLKQADLNSQLDRVRNVSHNLLK